VNSSRHLIDFVPLDTRYANITLATYDATVTDHLLPGGCGVAAWNIERRHAERLRDLLRSRYVDEHRIRTTPDASKRAPPGQHHEWYRPSDPAQQPPPNSQTLAGKAVRPAPPQPVPARKGRWADTIRDAGPGGARLRPEWCGCGARQHTGTAASLGVVRHDGARYPRRHAASSG